MDRTAHYPVNLSAPSGRTRLTSIGIVIAFHALMLAVLLWAGAAPPIAADTPAIEVNVLPGRVQYKIDEERPKFHPITPPKLFLIPPPDIVIESPDPSPIMVALPPSLGKGNQQAAMDDYVQRLHDHIAKFLIYPTLARVNGQQGTTIVHFIMDANNNVTLLEIKKSSGVLLLDKEALAVIKRAEMLPPVPAGWSGADLTLPVQFLLPGLNTTRRFGSRF